MKFPLYIAKRYLFSKSSNNAINFITIIAAIGVIIGSASLFIVLSGFAGLKDFSLQFTTLIDPELKATATQGKTFVVTDEQRNQLDNATHITSYTAVLEERVLINFKNKRLIATLKGVDENYPQRTIDSILLVGDWLCNLWRTKSWRTRRGLLDANKALLCKRGLRAC